MFVGVTNLIKKFWMLLGWGGGKGTRPYPDRHPNFHTKKCWADTAYSYFSARLWSSCLPALGLRAAYKSLKGSIFTPKRNAENKNLFKKPIKQKIDHIAFICEMRRLACSVSKLWSTIRNGGSSSESNSSSGQMLNIDFLNMWQDNYRNIWC